MSATSYLPRRWPSKYFRLNESLRPCSGWERVFSSRLVTDEFFEYAQNCIVEINLIINFFPHVPPVQSLIASLILLRFIRNGGYYKPSLVSLLVLLPQADSANSLRSFFRKSPRPISITRLKMLPLVYL